MHLKASSLLVQAEVVRWKGIGANVSSHSALSTAGSAPIVLDIRQISKSYQGVTALENATLQVRKGEIHAVLGGNGAGKSTLIGILSGVTQPDSGEFLLDGSALAPRNPRDAIKSGITTIYQELSLVPALTTLENIFLGRELMIERAGMKVLLDRKKMKKDVIELAQIFGISKDELDIPISEFGALKKKVIEIVKALTFDARILILDEPTSGLEEEERLHLFDHMRNLRSRGVGLIWVTHHLDELHGLADVATIFRDGRTLESLNLENSTVGEITNLMFGIHSNEAGSTTKNKRSQKNEKSNRSEVLSLHEVSRAGVLRDISFSLHAGEVIGISGLAGAGRTELANVIMGLDKRTSGQIFLKGKEVNFKSSASAYKAGIAMLPEDRKQLGIISGLSVAENISVSNLSSVSRFGFIISRKKERELATKYKEILSIRTPSVNQKINNLSGGSQQKAIVARCLNSNPTVLIIDEPTQGVDVAAKTEVHELIRDFISKGGAAIVIASEIQELLELSHEILVLRNGSIAGRIENVQDSIEKSRVVEIKAEVLALSAGNRFKNEV
jgi:ABC-type sugar transport system ATPase subunit